MFAAAAPVLALLAAATTHGEEGGNPLLRVSPGLWIWTLVVFLILFLVLRSKGFGVLIEKLEARDRAIRGAIDEAKLQREQAEALLAQQKDLLDRARKESGEMLSSAQEQAGREKTRIVAEARQEYERIVERGRAQIEQETRAAVAQIRQATAALAVDVAGRLIQKNLDQPAQRDLAARMVEELEQLERR